MGQHRSATTTRGISRWPVLAVVALLVLGGVIFGWLQLRSHNESSNSATVASCFDGDRTLSIAADPEIAPTLEQIATRYNDTAPVVRDHCITVTVNPQTTDKVLTALADGPPPDLPAIWVAQSGVDVAQARAAHPDALAPSSRSIAISPVQLAMTERQAEALGPISWQEVPARARDLGLALPDGADSGATTLALSAVVAAVTGSSDTPLTAEQITSPAARAGLTAMRAQAAARPFTDTADALAATADGPTGVLAVPVTAQRLQREPTVRAVTPAGTAPVADYPATTLSGAEADETLSRAASTFSEFARQPEQVSLLADAGFSAERPASALPTPDAAAIAAINPRQGTTPQTHATTILLDVSGSMREVDGDQSRLLNVTDALAAEIAALPDEAAVGLWRYSANLAGASPYAIDVTTGPLGDTVAAEGPRRQLLATALSLATPVSATHTYPSLEAAYASALESYRPGQANSVLLITDGPNDDEANKDSAKLLRGLAAAQDPARPVAVNIIVISDNSDMATLQSVADQTSGTLTAVGTSADTALAGAIKSGMG